MFTQSVIKNPSRSLRDVAKASAAVTTKGFVLQYTNGLAVQGDNGTTRTEVIGVCNKTISAVDAETVVPVIDIFEKDVWIADSTNNSNAAHNGQLMVLGANAGLVNNTGTTAAAGIVQQVGVYGAAADRKILVQFVQ